MAERRMFTKKITDDDAFISMPSSAQALYFHLNQSADDDGFTRQISNAMFKAHASEDDLKVLLVKNYIIRFESGVIVIKHWRMHNTLRKDRYTPTNHQEELELLGIKKDGAYTLNGGEPLVANRLPDGCQVVTTGKDSIGKDSIDKDNNIIMSDKPTEPSTEPKKRYARKPFVPPSLEEIQAYCRERKNKVDAKKFYDYFTVSDWYDSKGNKVKSWKQKVITWENNNNNKSSEVITDDAIKRNVETNKFFGISGGLEL